MTAVTRELARNFLMAAELRAKFDGLARPYLTARRYEEIAGALLSLEQAKHVGSALRFTPPDGAGGRRAA